MAAPPESTRVFHHPRPYRIEMNIRRKFQQIGICIDNERLISSLEKVSAPVPAPIDPPRVPKRQVLQNPRQRRIGYLNSEMYVIRHEAEGNYPMSEPLHSFLKEEVEAVTILIFEENVLARIPPRSITW
jgi:hypothetical protein